MKNTQNINILKKFQAGNFSESISLWADELKKNALNEIYQDLAKAIEHLEKIPENDESKKTYLSKCSALQSFFKINISTKFRQLLGDKKKDSPISGIKETMDGDIVVSDDFNHQIQVYDQNYQLKFSFGQKGKNPGEFYYPKGIEIDLDGNIYIADSWNHRIQKFTKDGKFVFAFGSYGSKPGQFNELVSIGINNKNQLLVVDRCNHRIQWFDMEGNYLGAIGHRGRIIEEDLAELYETPPEKFSHPSLEFPSDIAIDSKNEIYVVDSHNHRILKFDPNGKFILCFGRQGKEQGEFLYPQSIAIDRFDNIFISDLNNKRIQLFSPFGEHYFSFSGNGSKEKIESPTVLACGKDDTLFAGFAFSPEVLTFKYFPISHKERHSLKEEFSKSSATSLFLTGNLYSRENNPAEAFKNYKEALSIISTCEEKIIPELPLTYLKLAQKIQDEGISPHLLHYYDKKLSHINDTIIDTYLKRMDITQKLVDPILKDEKKVLEGKLASEEIDKNLYDLIKIERTLNRNTKELFVELRKIQSYQTEMFLLLTPQLISRRNNNELKPLIQKSLSNFFKCLDTLNSFLKDHDSANLKCFEELQKGNKDSFNLRVFRLAFTKMELSNDFAQFTLQILRNLVNVLSQMLIRLNASETNSNIDFFGLFIEESNLKKLGQALYKFRYDFASTLQLKEISKILLSYSKPNFEEIISKALDVFSFEKKSILNKDAFDFEKDLIDLLFVEEIGIEETNKGLRVGPFYFFDSDMDSLQSQFTINNEKNFTDLLHNLQSSINQLLLEKKELDLIILKQESKLQSVHPGDRSSRLRIAYEYELIIAQSAFGNKLIAEHLFLYRIINFKRCLYLLIEFECHKRAGDDKNINEIYHKINTYCDEVSKKLHEIKKNMKQIKINQELWTNNLNAILNSSPIDKAKEIEASNNLFQLAKDLEREEILKTEYSSILILQNKIKRYLTVKYQSKIKSTGISNSLCLHHNLQFGSLGNNDGQFQLPTFLCSNKNGDIFVTDRNNHRIQKFTTDGNHILTFGCYGDYKGFFNRPNGILCDDNNNLFVSDSLNHRIQKFDSDGNYIMSWGEFGDGEGQFNRPIAICQDTEDFIYIVEMGNHRIQKFTAEGEFIISFGKNGVNDGEFNQPLALCFWHDMILVGEATSDRIQIFDQNGLFIKSFHYSDGTTSNLQGTANISIDKKGNFYISEIWNNRLYIFSESLRLITSIGSLDNCIFFNGPAGVTFAGDYMFLCDHFNHRIHRFITDTAFTNQG